MGHRARVRRDRPSKSLFDTMTPEEVWRSTLRLRCACGAPGVMQILVFLPTEEMLPGGRHEDMGAKLALRHEGTLPVVHFRGPGGEPRKFTRALHAVGCSMCRKQLEIFAARAPSYAVVEVQTGPKSTAQVSVA